MGTWTRAGCVLVLTTFVLVVGAACALVIRLGERGMRGGVIYVLVLIGLVWFVLGALLLSARGIEIFREPGAPTKRK
jgi:hypothetical protein